MRLIDDTAFVAYSSTLVLPPEPLDSSFFFDVVFRLVCDQVLLPFSPLWSCDCLFFPWSGYVLSGVRLRLCCLSLRAVFAEYCICIRSCLGLRDSKVVCVKCVLRALMLSPSLSS